MKTKEMMLMQKILKHHNKNQKIKPFLLNKIYIKHSHTLLNRPGHVVNEGALMNSQLEYKHNHSHTYWSRYLDSTT